jgi:hypothetical protein
MCKGELNMYKDRLDLYKDIYNSELERKEKLISELTIPIAITTVLFGSIPYIIGKIGTISTLLPLIIYLAGLSVLVISLAVSAFYVIKSYHNYKYKCIATSKQMEAYYNECVAFYKNEDEADKIFQAYLIKDYCECNEINTKNNDVKAAYLHKSRNAIIVGLIVCAIVIITCNYQNLIASTNYCYKKITQSKEVFNDGCQITKSDSNSTAPTATAPSTTTNKGN